MTLGVLSSIIGGAAIAVGDYGAALLLFSLAALTLFYVK